MEKGELVVGGGGGEEMKGKRNCRKKLPTLHANISKLSLLQIPLGSVQFVNNSLMNEHYS